MHSFESFEGTPFEGVTPVDDTTRLLELVEIDFVDQQAAVLDHIETLGQMAHSPYSYHNTYIDEQVTNVFVRPIAERDDAIRITSNGFSTNHVTNETRRDIWDYIISLRTGFITERSSAFEVTSGISFDIPAYAGPVMWIGRDGVLRARSGSKYRLQVPVGIFGGWGDEVERRDMLTNGVLQPEKVIKGRLNNIERYKRLIALLGKLNQDTFRADAIIEEK
jgi:hypothetical protein